MSARSANRFKVIIVGSGFGGLCMAIKLKEAGLEDFVILEKAQDLGGTWRENTYPGAECDIPSALYSYSFAHNDTWKNKWSGQQQIHQYQHATAKKYSLNKHIIYQQHVVAASFDELEQRWHVTCSDGQEYNAQHFICAVGQLHHPSTPSFKAQDSFKGQQFHAAQWNHNVVLENKSVAVIGNAASAVQFVPELAKKVKHLTVFQRSPNWILPKINRSYSNFEQGFSSKFPALTKLYRWFLWAIGEYGMFPAIKGKPLNRYLIKRACLANIHKHIKSNELRQQLTPDYPIGAKRVLFSDHFYPALTQKNVDLNVSPIEEFVANGIIDKSGKLTKADVVVYGTGFKTNPFLADINVVGRHSLALKDAWKEGAHAYLGVSVSGFPNLHLLYGPNTNLAHTSIIIMLEAQSDYIKQLIQHTDALEKRAIDVKPEVESRYNEEIQSRLNKMSFSSIENSWYKDGNKVTNNWAGGTKEYQRRLRILRSSDFLFS